MSDAEGVPSYHPRDYPEGLDDFLNNIPRERRNEVRAAVVEAHFRDKAEKAWIDRQVQGMWELPDILYKYIPCQSLDYGLPRTLRATQPSALNDVMEGNIRTGMEGKMDREAWYDILSGQLEAIFREDTLSADELAKRKNLYGDPRISTIIREYLSQFVGVVSFSADPLIPTMWAHYAQNSGFVVGYNTERMKVLGVDLRRVLYLELAPAYTPTRDNLVRLDFVDEERREERARSGQEETGTPLLGSSIDFFELRRDWKELSKVLFVKGRAWESEKEIRLLVDLNATRHGGTDYEHGFPIQLLDVPTEVIEEVYVGFNTPKTAVARMVDVVGEGKWKLKHTDAHAYRIK